MLVHKLHKRLSLFDIARITVISAIPAVVGTIGLYVSSSAMLEKQTNIAVDRLVIEYEAILGTADMASRRVMDIQHEPCDNVIDRLRRETARQLYVRSLNLLRNGKVYCSSVLTNLDVFNKEYSRFKPGVTLLAGNVITPNSPVIYFRDDDVLSVIDARYMITPLRRFENGMELAVSINGNYLYSSGHVFDRVIKPFTVSKGSSRWRISVLGGFPPGTEWKVISGSYLPVLMLFLMASVITLLVQIRIALSGRITAKTIKQALKNKEIIPYAQPIFDSTGGRLWGIEILARWKINNGKMIPPDIFISIAEESSVIMEVTRSLMEQTAKELRGALEFLPDEFHVAFNISSKCCEGNKLINSCNHFNTELKNKVHTTVELTEREKFNNSNMLKNCIQSLKKEGIQIAIDDFGTAGSNLDYIREFSFDFIKIDKSYVSGIEYDKNSIHIIENIIDLANRLDMRIIAEGIEKPSQAEYLHEKGVHYFQGYLYSKPLPLATLINKYFRPLI